MTTEHTPTPWSYVPGYENGEPACFVFGVGEDPIVDLHTEPNAAFIVRAVNSFDAMKAALRSFIAHEKMVYRSEEIGGCIGALILQGEAALALAERGRNDLDEW